MSDRDTKTAWHADAVQEGAGGTVLVIDFSTMSAERDAADVVKEAFPGRPVWRIDPVVALTAEASPLDLDQMASRVERGLAEAGLEPELVVGYCSGTPLAMRVADRLDQGQGVPLVLLAPGFPAWEHVESDLANILRTMGVPSATPPRLPREAVSARAWVTTTVDDAIGIAIGALGLAEDEAAVLTGELAPRYKSWLGYLISIVTAKIPAVETDLCVIEMPEKWSRPDGGWPAHARFVDPGMTREELLESDLAPACVRRAEEIL
ncbi:hypothetical protein [Streptomyces rochei]|uniref:hypothetical protein n=1 Tax=Streptomyces rochei TaxID=1928 RepID=UPI0036961ABC